jgi:Zn-dependent protease with chaperone function
MRQLWAGLAVVLAGCVGPNTQFDTFDTAALMQEQQRQREVALAERIDETLRVQHLAANLLAAATPFCPDTQRKVHGLMLWTVDSVESFLSPADMAARDNDAMANLFNNSDVIANWQAAARQVYSVDDSVQVMAALTGTPAERSRLRQGDVLVRLGTADIPPGEKGLRVARAELAKLTKKGDTFDVVYRRKGIDRVVALTPAPACAYGVTLLDTNDVNASADGDTVRINRGLLAFVRNDVELATVIGHEIAHNALDHMTAQQLNTLAGALVGGLADALLGTHGLTDTGARVGQLAHSQNFEHEADYIGLYILARGGYDIRQAPALWRRMGAANPQSIEGGFMATHPSSAERFLALDAAVAEILAKQQKRQPLLPETKVPRR